MKKNFMSILLASFVFFGLATFASSCKDDSCVNPTETAAIVDVEVFDIDATYAKVFSGNGDVIEQNDIHDGSTRM